MPTRKPWSAKLKNTIVILAAWLITSALLFDNVVYKRTKLEDTQVRLISLSASPLAPDRLHASIILHMAAADRVCALETALDTNLVRQLKQSSYSTLTATIAWKEKRNVRRDTLRLKDISLLKIGDTTVHNRRKAVHSPAGSWIMLAVWIALTVFVSLPSSGHWHIQRHAKGRRFRHN